MTDLEEEINASIYKELGAFGDIVELSRKQILEGYVKPKNYKTPNLYEVTPVEDIPGEMNGFEHSFDEGSKLRWKHFHQKNPRKEEHLIREMGKSAVYTTKSAATTLKNTPGKVANSIKNGANNIKIGWIKVANKTKRIMDVIKDDAKDSERENKQLQKNPHMNIHEEQDTEDNEDKMF